MVGKKFLFLLVCFCLFFISPSPQKTYAQSASPCNIYIQNGQVFHLSECSSFEFISGWIAITKGLLTEFKGGTLITMTVTGPGYSRVFTPEEINQLFLAPEAINPAILGVECPMPKVWLDDFVIDLGSLEAGTYNLVLVYEYQHPINDGFGVCTIDGQPFPDNLYRGTQTFPITFTVN